MDQALTKRQVRSALEEPYQQDEEGLWRCRICPWTHRLRQSVGVHELKHRREFGLAPLPATTRQLGKAPTVITCSCGDQMMKHSLPTHLRGKHGLSRSEASFESRRLVDLARIARNGDGPSQTVVVAEVPDEPKASLWNGLNAVEAATGLLGAARTDGLMPVRLLPEVQDWISHTDRLLERLRQMTE